MGLPTNQTKGQGCNPVSSNCVIWQGPNIPCIDLCHGDSVTDVTFKLATELCNILDQLNVSTYDLTCFNPICPTPQNFHDLIQFLVGRICKIEDCVFEDCAPGCECLKCKEPTQAPDCPDKCIVTIAPCFQFTNNLGDTVTTMVLADYVQAIGVKLCQLIAQMGNTEARLGNVEARVGALEDCCNEPPVVLTVPTSCLLGPAPEGGWPVTTVLQNLETRFCELKEATGEPIELLQAVQKECTNLDQSPSLANRNSNMGSIPGWINQAEYNTVADSLNNMWLTICDLRAAVLNILNTCCCTDCDDVNIVMTATQSGTDITLFFTGSVPVGMTDCSPGGNLVTITDAYGGSYTTYVQVINNLNGSVVISISGTPVNPATNLTITLQGCWNRATPGASCGGLKCERNLVFTIINTSQCPQLVLTPSIESIDYSFTNNVSGPVTYEIQLYTAGGTFVASQSSVNPPVSSTVSGTFNGLTGGTDYYIVVKVTINGVTVTCPQAFISTLPYPCQAPTAVSATPIVEP